MAAMKNRSFLKSEQGFTLVELIVVMGIFILVLMVTSTTFETIIKKAGAQSRTATSNIEGIVGLDVLRFDLEHAGYGLPWGNVPAIQETVVADNAYVTGISHQGFNSVGGNGPHAVLFGPSAKEVSGIDGLKAGKGPDYLVVKSVVASMTPVSKKWTYVNYSTSPTGNASFLKKWTGGQDFVNNEKVITIASGFSTQGTPSRQLITNGATFHYSISGQTVPSAFMPGDATQLYIVYGVAGAAETPRMPYNRADFYVKRPASGMPPSCNSGTGIFYKAIVAHDATGTFSELPLINCVGDMQVVLESNNNGVMSYNGVSLLPAEIDPADQRNQLKTVRVYLLGHEGGKDTGFTYPYTDESKVIVVGDPLMPSQARTWTKDDMVQAFGSDWRNYRWKVYSVTVRPKNLN